MVNNYVETKYLKAHLVLEIVGLAGAVQVVHVRLRDTHRLNYDILHLLDHLVDRLVSVNSPQLLNDRCI